MSDYSQTRSFNIGIATDTSIEAAMIYDDLVYAQRVFGKGYFFRSYEQMRLRFPMLSVNTLRRHVKKLEETGWISTKVKKLNGKPTCHYQIERFLSTKMRDSKENANLGDSINIETKKETKETGTKEELKTLFFSLVVLLGGDKKRTLFTDGRASKLKARLKHFSGEDLGHVAQKLKNDEFMQKGGYATIDYLLRNDEKVELWLNRPDEKPQVSAQDHAKIQDQLVKERMEK